MENSCAEKEVLMRFMQGDEAVFVLLYEQYHHAIYLNVMRLIHNTADAEDIVQDVFLTLWRKRDKIDRERPVKGWLFTVSYNLTIDLLKKKLRKPVAMPHEEYISMDNRDKGFPELQWSLMEEAMNSLSPQKKKVFQLCKLEGKSYDQAAAELGISKYTINEYLKDGMSFIRKYVHEKTAFQDVIIILLLQPALVPFLFW